LDFVEGKPRIAYAPSIGISKYSQINERRVLHYLSKFNKISLREKSAKEYLADLTGRKDIAWVCDPVFLFDKDYWKQKQIKRTIAGRYLFCYFIEARKEVCCEIETFARNRGLQIVTFPFMNSFYKKFEAKFGDEQLYDVTPFEWLYLLDHAEWVITDSFHCSLFSTLFHKNFKSVRRNKFSSRFDIFNRLGVGDLVVDSYDINHDSEFEIDWETVDKRIDDFRIESLEWLKSAIESSKEAKII
jgi:hypothetical protein